MVSGVGGEVDGEAGVLIELGRRWDGCGKWKAEGEGEEKR